MIERKDAGLDFGTATAGAFENVIDLGKSEADGLEVVFTVPTAITSSTTFTVMGGDTAADATNEIARTTVTSAEAGSSITVGIPRGHGYEFIAAGTSSSAAVTAVLDTYAGK